MSFGADVNMRRALKLAFLFQLLKQAAFVLPVFGVFLRQVGGGNSDSSRGCWSMISSSFSTCVCALLFLLASTPSGHLINYKEQISPSAR